MLITNETWTARNCLWLSPAKISAARQPALSTVRIGWLNQVYSSIGYIFCEQNRVTDLISLISKFPLPLHISLPILSRVFISFEILHVLTQADALTSAAITGEVDYCMHFSLATCWMFCPSPSVYWKHTLRTLGRLGLGRPNTPSANLPLVNHSWAKGQVISKQLHIMDPISPQVTSGAQLKHLTPFSRHFR